MSGNENKTSLSRLLSKKQLLEIVPLSYPTIWELIRAGEFPRGLVLSEKAGKATRIAFREDEVRAWIESRRRQELKGDGQGSEQDGD